MLILEGRRPRPTSMKNRRLVLTEAPGCTFVAFFLTLPSFLVGRILRTRFLLQGKKLLFSMDVLVFGYGNYISFFIL